MHRSGPCLRCKLWQFLHHAMHVINAAAGNALLHPNLKVKGPPVFKVKGPPVFKGDADAAAAAASPAAAAVAAAAQQCCWPRWPHPSARRHGLRPRAGLAFRRSYGCSLPRAPCATIARLVCAMPWRPTTEHWPVSSDVAASPGICE